MTDIVSALIDNLEQAVSQVDEIAGRSLYMYDQDDLLSLKKQINFPCAGVIYEGMQPKQDRQGRGVTVNFSVVVLIGDGQNLTNPTLKVRTTDLLDRLRNSIRLLESPSGHTWRFEQEGPVPLRDDLMAYAQSWSTVAIV